MKRIKLISATMLILIVCCSRSYSQAGTPININDPVYQMPSLVGWHGGLGVNAHYGNQWPGIPNNFIHYNVSVDGYAHKLRSAFGINGGQNGIGDGSLVKNYAQFHWSPKIQLSEQAYLSPSLSLQYFQQSIDWSRFINPTGEDGTSTVNALGIGSGLAFIRNGLIVSANLGFLNQPDISFFADTKSRLPRVYQVQAMQRFDFSEKFSVTPSILFQQQGNFNHLMGAVNANYDGFGVALGYRHQDAVVAAISYEIKRTLRIAYSYGITVGPLGTQQTMGSHEIGVRTILFRGKAKRSFYKDLPVL